MAKTKKAVKRRSTRPAVRKASRPAGRPAAAAKSRLSWLDTRQDTPVIERYARQLSTFIQALADGVVDAGELKAQEQRLVKLMKEIEPQLGDRLHAQVTRLLCELTAYDLMQVLHSMHAARPKVAFRG